MVEFMIVQMLLEWDRDKMHLGISTSTVRQNHIKLVSIVIIVLIQKNELACTDSSSSSEDEDVMFSG